MRVSVEILDIAYGQPADDVLVRLDRAGREGWKQVGNAVTDSEGRVDGWGPQRLESGLYRITFDSDSYFAGFGASASYPEVTIVFRLLDKSQTCRIQVRLSACAYSTNFSQFEISGHPSDRQRGDRALSVAYRRWSFIH